MTIVVIGLSITSSWGNGHATTYRALLKAVAALGHQVIFLEHDKPWYAVNRDLPSPAYCTTHLYSSVAELQVRHQALVRHADAVIVGSYVPEGIAVGDWVLATARGQRAFYDIDTPVTLAQLRDDTCAYLAPRQVAAYDTYFSFTGGPTLDHLSHYCGSPNPKPLFCSVDSDLYYPEPPAPDAETVDLGYLGTYSPDRQPTLQELLFQPALSLPERRFCVAGSQYPADMRWPANVVHIPHLPPAQHRRFYNQQRYTLNVTRADMVAAGHSPSVRLFEAGACGTPVLSDAWPGLDDLFRHGREIIICRYAADVLSALNDIPEAQRQAMGLAFRQRVLAQHTAHHRAIELLTALGSSVHSQPRAAA